MERNMLIPIVLIAVILSASGLAVGTYSIISAPTKGNDGDDGDDGAPGTTTIVYQTEDQYPCASEQDINDSLDAIGDGYGKIMITDNINLNSPIIINGGGSYIIEGIGFHTIDCGDGQAFRILNAKSCKIKDLLINASSLTFDYKIIEIFEINDNPVFIDGVQILGGLSLEGNGIYVSSDNVWISNCIFNSLKRGITIDEYINHGHINDNEISKCETYGIGLLSNSQNFTIGENRLFDFVGSARGIAMYSSNYATISNNIIHSILRGILLSGSNRTTIIGNTIDGKNRDLSPFSSGIHLLDSSYNVISGNSITNYLNGAGGSTGYGIRIREITDVSYENTVVGNTALSCDTNFDDSGTNTFGDNTLNNFD
ncbi:MAG: hypothetical protein GF383_12470 [Candidatus Lokiarchaeota archaeon]|nr:hypothetical protein [Candidatus Lokiarchaeota archaeon]MBD3341824.1 hypothetical protein [Candidatus Lokiarchaeota archaeon]